MIFDRKKYWLVLAFAAAPASAQSTPPAATADPSGDREIVVTGIPLRTTENRLRDCIARGCAPAEDVAATLAHAENTFVAGDYAAARTTLLASLGRNRRYGNAIPIEVSGLLRANSRVAAHLGEKEASLTSARDVVRTLRDGLPEGDVRVLTAQIELGDDIARSGDLDGAIGMYRDVIRQSRKYARPIAEAYARLHMANLYIALGETDGGLLGAADREIAALAGNPDPIFAPFAAAAGLARAKASARRGDQAAIDRLIQSYKADGAQTKPMLIYAPRLDADQLQRPRDFRPETSRLARLQANTVEDQWVDIGFWIAADGTVSNVETLRESPKLAGKWYEPITKGIAGRRYAAYTPPAGRAGTMHVERYTFTANLTTTTGTRIRVRDPQARIEMVDLTS